jgi:hypothetical protein
MRRSYLALKRQALCPYPFGVGKPLPRCVEEVGIYARAGAGASYYGSVRYSAALSGFSQAV